MATNDIRDVILRRHIAGDHEYERTVADRKQRSTNLHVPTGPSSSFICILPIVSYITFQHKALVIIIR